MMLVKRESIKKHSVAKCLGPYDRIIAVINNMKVRDQEEKNKIFTIYSCLFIKLFSSESNHIGVLLNA